MKDIIKKSFLLGVGAATLTKNQAEKLVKDLVKKNAVTIKEGRDMIRRISGISFNESNRIRKLAKNEAKRVTNNLSGLSRTRLASVKKNLKAIDKELSKKGKDTVKKILKELSK